jgi:signal transduction histidine kinase
VYRDPAGAIWWLCGEGIYRYNAGTYTKLALPPSFPKPYLESGIAATEDGSGALWLAAVREGLFYRKAGEWQRLETASEFAKFSPHTAFTDWMGRAWFGYEGGAIILLKDERIQRVFRAADSPVGSVRAINGRGHHTWVGGESGLAFFDGNRFRWIIPVDAKAFGSVLGIEEAFDGSLWLAEHRGVVQIPAPEVRQALENPSYRVEYRIFDSFDGLPGTFIGTALNQKETQATDGKLWFSASGGVVWIDPANISTNTLPPPISVRSVSVNGRQFDSLSSLVLPPRTTNLQIGYTALSLSVPERVRFRYMLEGVDKEWHDAGTRREAFYTRLGPGDYHFRVIACNNDGVWNETGASLDFSIAPTYYQTNWFRALCGIAILALLWGIYLLRLRQLQRQFAIGLEARVNERTRIARDLHDTLLQSFQGLMLRLQLVEDLLPEGKAKTQLEQTLQRADQAIAEGRRAVYDLRSSSATPTDLAQAVRSLGEEFTTENSAAFNLVVEGTARDLNTVIRDELYLIVREALQNAFNHARAHQIEAEIIYGVGTFRLRIRDDGEGIPTQIMEEGRPGHYGLSGMRERANQIGGKLELWSKAGAGTEIQLSIPGSGAYRASLIRSLFSLLRKKQGEP